MRRLLQIIGVLTSLTGLVQMAAPGFVLRMVGGQGDAAALHCFAIVGMFMVLFGGLMAQGARPGAPAFPMGYAAAQKVGAAAAVALGIHKGLFGPIAWLVAGFDFASGILAILYLRSRTSPKGNRT